MNAILLLVNAALLVQGSMGGTWMGYLDVHPDYPDQCYIPETHEAHAVGTSWNTPGQCMEVTCGRHGDRYIISGYSCGTVRGPRECRLVSDLTKPYPKCCPEIVC